VVTSSIFAISGTNAAATFLDSCFICRDRGVKRAGFTVIAIAALSDDGEWIVKNGSRDEVRPKTAKV